MYILYTIINITSIFICIFIIIIISTIIIIIIIIIIILRPWQMTWIA